MGKEHSLSIEVDGVFMKGQQLQRDSHPGWSAPRWLEGHSRLGAGPALQAHGGAGVLIQHAALAAGGFRQLHVPETTIVTGGEGESSNSVAGCTGATISPE